MLRRVLPILLALIAAATLVTAGGRTVGIPGFWGFHFLTYVSPYLRAIMALAVVAAALPLRWPVRVRARIPVPWWAAVPAGMALFWLLRERVHHGDAEFKIWLLGHESLRTDPFVWKEPLDAFLAYTLTGLLRPWDWPPDRVVALASVAAGGVYLAAVGWGVRRLAAGNAALHASMAAALFALGSSLLWFGHVENYSLVTAFTMVTVMLAAVHLAARDAKHDAKHDTARRPRTIPLWLIGAAGGLAVSFHPQAAFAMPALLALPRRGRRLTDTLQLLAGGLLPVLATVALFRALGVPWPETKGGFARDPQLFWTPAQALAPARLADAIQNLWLLVPAWPLWVAAGIAPWFRAGGRKDPVARYLTFVAAGFLVYHLAFQNDLGRRKDWDLFAIVGPPVAFWGVRAWRGLEDDASEENRVLLGRLLVVGLVFSALFAVAWIGVNARYRVLMF